MLQSVVGRWEVGGKLQVLSGPWLMVGLCSLNVQGCLHEALFVPVLCYGSENDKERKREV